MARVIARAARSPGSGTARDGGHVRPVVIVEWATGGHVLYRDNRHPRAALFVGLGALRTRQPSRAEEVSRRQGMEKLKIGIVGLNFGREIIARELITGPAQPYFELAAVCDLVVGKADQAAKQY